MKDIFADRMGITHKSFIREILKVTESPEIISFAGGLPNPRYFPSEEIASAALEVLKEDGAKALQYSTTEGYYPLREYIAKRYLEKKGIDADPEEILITSGSQQGIDLLGKVFLNKGDHIMLEKPGYLGAIQAFTSYEPVFHQINLCEDGIDTRMMEEACEKNEIKLFYTVPNFQNPSGISYSSQKRREVAEILQGYNTVLIEDDPYGELRFMGEDLPYIGQALDRGSVLLGSFSKTIAPGLRLGWIYAQCEIMEKAVIAKQASDLHSNLLSQRIVHRYLCDNDPETRMTVIKSAYKRQRDTMVSAIRSCFPEGVKCTEPEGGMFLWITLPENVSAMELFDLSIAENVAFVPGSAFYTDGGGTNTLRLNYSNSDQDMIEEGINRLSKALQKLMR